MDDGAIRPGQGGDDEAYSGKGCVGADGVREVSRLPEPRQFPAATEVIEGIMSSLMELFNIELTVMKDSP